MTETGNNNGKNGNDSKKPETAANSSFLDVPSMRIPEAYVMLSPDQDNGDKHYEGTVGLKYGSEKGDWLRLSYMSMKKVIDFCTENKEQFNKQLQIEREKNLVSDL